MGQTLTVNADWVPSSANTRQNPKRRCDIDTQAALPSHGPFRRCSLLPDGREEAMTRPLYSAINGCVPDGKPATGCGGMSKALGP